MLSGGGLCLALLWVRVGGRIIVSTAAASARFVLGLLDCLADRSGNEDRKSSSVEKLIEV